MNDSRANFDAISLLQSWKHSCNRYSTLHNECRIYYRKMNHYLMISSMLLASTGSIGSLTVSLNNNNCHNTINIPLIIFSSLSIFSTLLLSIHRFLALPEMQKEHDLYGDLYSCLGNEINLQLTIGNHESKMYKNTIEFAKYCKYKLDILIDKDPAILSFIAQKHPELNV